MKKKFINIQQIESFYEQRKKQNELARLNYYKYQTQKYIDKVDPESGLLLKYKKKLEKYKIANANKIERQKKSAIAQFKNNLKQEIWEYPVKRKLSVNVWNNQKKEKITKTKAKQEFQLYAKISRADKNWIVQEITTDQFVHWRECDGWHYISASVKQTCFDIDNVRPQFSGSNMIMSMGDKNAEQEKEKYRKNLIKRIWKERVEELDYIWKYGKNTLLKVKAPSNEEIYNKYKKLNDEIFSNNPTWSRNKAKDKSYQNYLASK